MNPESKFKARNRTILLVSEQDNDWKILYDLARIQGYNVQVCESSLEVIQYIQTKGLVSVVIVDEAVSPPDGLQTYDYLKSELKISQPFLIAYHPDKITYRAEKKLLGYLEKPFNEETFEKIEAFLDQQKNTAPISRPVYSLEYLRDISEGDEDFILDSLKIFNNSIASKLMEINSSLSRNEFKTIGAIAHNIKPSFEMLESAVGSEICNRIVYQAPEKEIPDLIADLNREFNRIYEQLIKDFPKLTLS